MITIGHSPLEHPRWSTTRIVLRYMNCPIANTPSQFAPFDADTCIENYLLVAQCRINARSRK